MTVLAITVHSTDKGNVIPGLVIAVLSASANAVFWSKYERLGKKTKNPILLVQARLYRAKTLIDTCVTAALVVIMIFPESTLSHALDLGGSAVVAIYLLISGIKTVVESVKALNNIKSREENVNVV